MTRTSHTLLTGAPGAAARFDFLSHTLECRRTRGGGGGRRTSLHDEMADALRGMRNVMDTLSDDGSHVSSDMSD